MSQLTVVLFRILQEEDSKERIENLAQFQEKAIKKAMTIKKPKRYLTVLAVFIDELVCLNYSKGPF